MRLRLIPVSDYLDPSLNIYVVCSDIGQEVKGVPYYIKSNDIYVSYVHYTTNNNMISLNIIIFVLEVIDTNGFEKYQVLKAFSASES